MTSRLTVAALGALSLTQAFARLDKTGCGSYRDRAQEQLHLHRRAMARRKAGQFAAIPASAIPDYGDIAIVDDSGGVVDRRNPFDLDQRTIQFSFAGVSTSQYQFQVSAASYDSAAASAGAAVPLGDDDSAALALPFPFPFFGATYQNIFVNSDGNLTFQSGDSLSWGRSLGRMVAGPPRIAPLFMDLDPSQTPDGVRVLSEANRFVVSWVRVPEYSDFGSGPPETLQARLYPDGRIEFAYDGVTTDGAVVGISPGGLQGPTSMVSLSLGTTGIYSGTVAETFSATDAIDEITAAQRFYESHEDSYDYLVFYNTEGIGPCAGAVACEITVRNNRSGYGDIPIEIGEELGSASRLQSVLNMGSLSEYPADPNAAVPARGLTGDTPLTLLGHESGHLFAAYASARDPNDPNAYPMLDAALAHWAFTFNSDASIMQGNRIEDEGAGAEPRFVTTATVQGYSALDQYLMGFRAPEETPPTFLVSGPTRAFALQLPRAGISFDGVPESVSVDDIIAAEGRRTPDSTVSQRHFHWGFVLIVPEGSTPSQVDLGKVESYRSQFAAFYEQAASGRATADTALRWSLTLSTFPAAGVFAGKTIAGTVSIQTPAEAPLTIALATRTGAATADSSVIIPAGATSALFHFTGVAAGVDEIDATPSDPRYDTAVSRIQVLSGPDAAQLAVSSDSQGVTVRVTDVNNLPYPGVEAQASNGATATTDANGQAVLPPGSREDVVIH